MTTVNVAQIKVDILRIFDTRDAEAAWKEVLDPAGRCTDRNAAFAILQVLDEHEPDFNLGEGLLKKILDLHEADDEVVLQIGKRIEIARDMAPLNDTPPTSELFEQMLSRLSVIAAAEDEVKSALALDGLATTARLMGRQHDAITERSYRRLIELDPNESYCHYNYGLFLKTRGRFVEGLEANETARRLAHTASEAILWNFGICATGSGRGGAALEIWKELGQKIEIGRFGLPEGNYSTCKVRLAERPLAERDRANDDPGLEETIWIERLSPCHGIIRNVLYQNLGVDYGDVVLIDGAPITYHRYGEDSVPVFPHLATLFRRGFQFFDFAGIQSESRQLAATSAELCEEAVVYSHTEGFHILCAACWRDARIDHEHGEQLTKNVVTGRIAAPPDVFPAALIKEIDTALASRKGCELYSPSLCEAAGLNARAAEERLKFELLLHSGPEQ
jgi:tetratricopeptide (TPR) repeat protein